MASPMDGRILLITGGTGSFGNAILKLYLDTDIGEIRIFSRDEKKQNDMREHYRNLLRLLYVLVWNRLLRRIRRFLAR